MTGQSADDFSDYIRAMDSEYLAFDPENTAPAIKPPVSLRELAANLSRG